MAVELDMAAQSTQVVNGWFHTEDFMMHRVMTTSRFWSGVWQHVAFPVSWLVQRQSVGAKVNKLRANPSTQKLAKDALEKARAFLCCHLTLTASGIMWHLLQFYAHDRGQARTDLYSAGQLVLNISLLMPIVVYVFFYSGISSIVAAHHAIFFRRRAALPPILLLGGLLEGTRSDDHAYDDDMLLKTISGFSGYEQWEETFETFYVEEMLGVAATTRGDSERQVGGGEVGGRRPQGPHAQPAAVHQWWRERMIGVPDAASVTRIRRWMHDIHAKARASGIWQRLWLPLVAFNCVHVVWPVLLAAQQVQAGTLGTATLLLTIPQSVASGYLWNNALRLSMLAVMHFARMRSIAQQVTRLVATGLRLPSEVRASEGRGGLECAGVLDAATVKDWWRLRILLICASTSFSSLYWLHFACMLLGNVVLVAGVMIYMIFADGQRLQMRYVFPVAVDNLAIVLTAAGVLYFCLLTNAEFEKTTKALAARRVELWVNSQPGAGPPADVDHAMELLLKHMEAPAPLGQHRLLGLLPVTTDVMAKMMGLLVSGPLAFAYRLLSRTRHQRLALGESFF